MVDKSRRRVYYDHEPAYEVIKASGGRGWDDLNPGVEQGSYDALDAFLAGEMVRAGATVLDLGCGGGQVALRLARLGARASGIDYSETAIELAIANACEAGLAAQFVVGDAIELAAFADASFELVVDNHCLHCIVTPEDRARLLASVYRVLVPGGRLWSGTMSAEGKFDAARFAADPVTGVAHDRTRIWIRRAVLEQELLAAGFEIVALVPCAPTEDGTDLVTLARRPG